MNLAKYPHECFLGQIFGFGRVFHHAQAKAVDTSAVQPINKFEGSGIPWASRMLSRRYTSSGLRGFSPSITRTSPATCPLAFNNRFALIRVRTAKPEGAGRVVVFMLNGSIAVFIVIYLPDCVEQRIAARLIWRGD
jgi:hypothetical protein